MEGAQVFSCNFSTNVKSIFSKNTESLYLKVENDKISGKGYVCNEEGKNGYIDEFSFSISEIKNVFIGEYMDVKALGFNARIANIYGAKKVQVMLPQLKNMDLVIGLLKRLKNNAEAQEEERRAASRPAVQAPQAAVQTAAAQATAQAAPSQMQVQPAQSLATAQPKASTYQQSQVVPAERGVPVGETKKAEVEADDRDQDAEEFNRRMEKLTVLRDCGLLGEKEFNAKKIELVSEFCDLTDFNEKIQKLIVLKDCGLLSEKEFEANRVDIIKECCNTETSDMKEYRRSVQKLSFLEMGGVITTEEYERYKQVLVDDTDFKLSDSKEVFVKKLKRLPVLKESQLITDKEYKQKLEAMYEMIEVNSDDEIDNLADKLNKWPLLAQERLITASELKEKQKNLVASYLNMNWTTSDELMIVIKKLMALKQGEWLTEMDYFAKREDLLRRVNAIEDYVTKIQTYMMLANTGFVDDAEYQKQKQRCIDDIFKPCASMDEFKGKVNNLLELQKAGMITEQEFVSFKTKLMSEL
ncbi:MAG: hypothetical protein IJF07_08035 [Lachnospiraceae bacterium]|nr:hypothetical protein [Lachnospiraceae bacterium]